jgi:hypothetical protein
MLSQSFHLSDQELLLWADGEVSSKRAAQIRQHLNGCWMCRARMTELEHAIGDFVQLYRRELDVTLPPVEGPRALLKARLAERAASGAEWADNWLRARQVAVAGAIAALLLLTGIAMWRPHETRVREASAIPNGSLTPGATNPIGIQDVCSASFASNDPEVPDDLKREVWKAYGVKDMTANAYQIDYLVTPQLGGATSIRNLWPQPSVHTVWNARVKDALEDRLRNMVCSGQLDLATAQREISQNWVEAYKKYFRTNAPLQVGATPESFKM